MTRRRIGLLAPNCTCMQSCRRARNLSFFADFMGSIPVDSRALWKTGSDRPGDEEISGFSRGMPTAALERAFCTGSPRAPRRAIHRLDDDASGRERPLRRLAASGAIVFLRARPRRGAGLVTRSRSSEGRLLLDEPAATGFGRVIAALSGAPDGRVMISCERRSSCCGGFGDSSARISRFLRPPCFSPSDASSCLHSLVKEDRLRRTLRAILWIAILFAGTLLGSDIRARALRRDAACRCSRRRLGRRCTSASCSASCCSGPRRRCFCSRDRAAVQRAALPAAGAPRIDTPRGTIGFAASARSSPRMLMRHGRETCCCRSCCIRSPFR